MLQRVLHFIKYNNALPIGFAILFLGASGVFAASPEAREAVYAREQSVVSVDNSYIVNINLSTYTPRTEIESVTEDDASYYISYNFRTIDLVDGTWQDVIKERNLAVAKDALGNKDLGAYVTRELREVIDSELVRLKETQKIERSIGKSQKTVATAYNGLIGRFVDTSVEVLPEYEPASVVSETDTAQVAAAAASQEGATESSPTPVTSSTVSGDSSDTEPPVIQILGNNPAEIVIKARYVDLGAVVTDNRDANLGITVEGEQIDTSAPGEHVVTYSATDQAGNTTTATRIVRVYDPNPEPEPVQATTTTSQSSDGEGETSATTTPANEGGDSE